MKKTILLFTILSSICFFGCKKEGPAGPAGPQGAAGPTGTSGSTIVAVDSFIVQTNEWVMTQPANYKFVYTNTDITSEIVTDGTLNVYVKDYQLNNSWYALPDVVAGGSGYRFSYELNTLTLYADNFSSGVPRPLKFRAVIIKK